MPPWNGSAESRIRLLFIGHGAEALRPVLASLQEEGVVASHLPSIHHLHDPSEYRLLSGLGLLIGGFAEGRTPPAHLWQLEPSPERRARRFDLVFLLLHDPPEAVTAQVSALRLEFAHSPLWVIAEADRKDLVVAALRAGASGYLSRPVTEEELRHLLGLNLARPHGLHEVLRAEDLTALYEVAQSVSSSPYLEDVLTAVLDRALYVTEADWGLIALTDPDRQELQVEAVGGIAAEEISRLTRLQVGEGITGHVALTGLPYLSHDTRRDPRYLELHHPTLSLLAVPLRYKEEVIGVLSLGAQEAEAFGERDVHILTAIGTQAAIAVENARLIEQAEQAIAALADIGQALAQGQGSPAQLTGSVLELILERALEITGATRGTVQLLETEAGELVIAVARGVERERWHNLRLQLGQGITGHVAQTGKPYLCPDTRRDPYYIELIPGILSELAVPLIENGQVIGVLNLESRRTWAFTAKHQRLLTALADQAVLALTSAQTYGELLVLNTIGQHLDWHLADNGYQGLLQTVVRAITEHLNTQSCSIFLYDEEQAQYVLRATEGLDKELVGVAHYAVGEGFTGWIAAHGVPLRVVNPEKDPRWKGKYREQTVHRVATYLGVPILARGRVLGVLRVVDKIPSPGSPFTAFTASDERLLQTIAGQLGIVLENVQLVTDLKRASQIKSEFIANLSHELKTPLTAIRLASQILLRDSLPPTERQRFLTIIQMEIERYARLINKIILLSRMEAGEAVPHRYPAYLSRIFQRATTIMELEAREKGVSFTAVLSSELPRIRVDADMIEQAMLNLLSNAVKYTPTGGHVWARLDQEGDEAVFEVVDDGPGIPAEEQRRVFEKFFRGSTPYAQPEAEGVGLGLAITQHIVEVHGGRIEIASQPGKGTTARIRLPLKGFEVPDAHPRRPPAKATERSA